MGAGKPACAQCNMADEQNLSGCGAIKELLPCAHLSGLRLVVLSAGAALQPSCNMWHAKHDEDWLASILIVVCMVPTFLRGVA